MNTIQRSAYHRLAHISPLTALLEIRWTNEKMKQLKQLQLPQDKDLGKEFR